MNTAGEVHVRRHGRGFVVECNPPDPAHPAQVFDTMRAAWGYAGGVKLTTGRHKIDSTGDIEVENLRSTRRTRSLSSAKDGRTKRVRD